MEINVCARWYLPRPYRWAICLSVPACRQPGLMFELDLNQLACDGCGRLLYPPSCSSAFESALSTLMGLVPESLGFLLTALGILWTTMWALIVHCFQISPNVISVNNLFSLIYERIAEFKKKSEVLYDAVFVSFSDREWMNVPILLGWGEGFLETCFWNDVILH